MMESRRALYSLRQIRVASSSSTPSPSLVQRHGPGDGVITLNVGGKNFQTLRSTIAQNDVLMDHVVRAEANMEMGTDRAIFIDRDPKHFGMILSYLRNKADDISYGNHRLLKFGSAKNESSNSKSLTTAKEATKQIISKSLPTASFVQLPNDSKTLTEMYFESIHYSIPELTNRICSQQSLTRIFGIFGSTNPFQMATTALTVGKRILMLFGGVLTGMGGWVYAQAMAAQAKTSKYIEAGREGIQTIKNPAEFWEKEAEYWKIIADKWNGSSDEK